MRSTLDTFVAYGRGTDPPSAEMLKAAQRIVEHGVGLLEEFFGVVFDVVSVPMIYSLKGVVDSDFKAAKVPVSRQDAQVVFAFVIGAKPGGQAWAYGKGGYASTDASVLFDVMERYDGAVAWDEAHPGEERAVEQLMRDATRLWFHEIMHTLGLSHPQPFHRKDCPDDRVMCWLSRRAWRGVLPYEGFIGAERDTIRAQMWLRLVAPPIVVPPVDPNTDPLSPFTPGEPSAPPNGNIVIEVPKAQVQELQDQVSDRDAGMLTAERCLEEIKIQVECALDALRSEA